MPLGGRALFTKPAAMGELLFRGRDARAVGAITAVAGNVLVDNGASPPAPTPPDWFDIQDALGNVKEFEFDADTIAIRAGAVLIPFLVGDTAAQMAVKIRDAINAQHGAAFRVTAAIDPGNAARIIVTCDEIGDEGNLAAMTETVTDPGFTITANFTGGRSWGSSVFGTAMALMVDDGLEVEVLPQRIGMRPLVQARQLAGTSRPIG